MSRIGVGSSNSDDGVDRGEAGQHGGPLLLADDRPTRTLQRRGPTASVFRPTTRRSQEWLAQSR